ncbi:hypothetical protein DL546_007390 [Coniochaeta pulveracea]|uniref:Rhodopsin domain-containing protein n=1 Tax=Coniochaeta pulveracea TaxID=177199 RepID=A0A420YL76_9PEZI|nr:hypothetical protein DL546_007390 [Coniochaeta pulveracea]
MADLVDILSGRLARVPDDPDDVRRLQTFALVPTIIIMVLSITTYLLRLYCRKKTGQDLGCDDYLMGIGLLISLEPCICEILLVYNGLGHHIWNVPKEQAARFAKISFALQRANQISLCCIKVSIVMFYLRIFGGTRQFRRAAYAVIGYTVAWAISTWIVNLTVCTPIAYYYDRTIPGGTCRNQAISGSINGGLSLLGDVLVLALPMPVIWNLKVNFRRKVGIICIFLLGVFVCVASIVRIVELTKFVVTDPTYTQVHASTWTTIEQGVAVISGNLPLLTPLFERFFRNKGTGYGSSGYGKASRLPDSGAEGSSSDRFGRRANPKLVFHGEPGITTVTAKRSHHDNYSLSDEESNMQADSTHGIELEDTRAILVKTQVTVTEARQDESGAPESLPAEPRSGSWLRS